MNSDRQHEVAVGVDGSAESDAAIAWAADEAARRRWRLTLVHAVPPVTAAWPPVGAIATEITEWQRENARHIIEQSSKTLEANLENGDVHWDSEVMFFAPAASLVDISKRARLIVVGSRGTGALRRGLLGSVSTGVLHHARCPVAVVHLPQGEAVSAKAPVLVGVDGSHSSDRAIEWAFDEASQRGVSLVALHAWSDVPVYPAMGPAWPEFRKEGARFLAERISPWQRRYPEVPVEQVVTCDQAAHRLVGEAERCQLVITGSHGRGGFASLLLGSVSSAVAHSVDVPVIVVRG